MVKNTATVILAAGKSTRMNSSFSKVLHKIYGKTMLEYITDSIRAIGINKICIVTNRNNDLSKAVDKTGGIDLVFQDKLMGTGHALRQTSKVFENFNGDLLVLYGDTPLLKSDVLKNLVEKHKSSKAACTLLTTSVSDPKGYGRIIRDKKNDVVDIVEENVASVREKMIKEINVGVYCFNAKEVFKVLQGLKAKGSKSEYYLTDAVGMLAREKHAIESLHIEDIDQTLGVNTRLHLARAQAIVKERILTQHMMEGVGIIDPETTHIYHDVTIGQDTIIYPFTVIERDVVIGKRCRIGPFARIRPGCVLKDEVEIGNYVEMVRTKVGSGSAIRHKSYIGDAFIGARVNIEPGAITANSDGKKKHRTIIEDNAFIGGGTTMVAPVHIGKGAVTEAGSMIPQGTKVPAGSVIAGIPAKIVKKNRK